MPTLGVLGQLKSGQTVIDRQRSEIYAAPKELLASIGEALETIRIPGFDQDPEGFWQITVDLGKIIGGNAVVEIQEGDEVRYGIRRGKPYASTFVLGRQPEPCSQITLILKRATREEDTAILIAAWVGPPAPREVWDTEEGSEEYEEAREFWLTHAFVHGSVEMEDGSLTDQTPFWLQ